MSYRVGSTVAVKVEHGAIVHVRITAYQPPESRNPYFADWDYQGETEDGVMVDLQVNEILREVQAA